ncbi:MAG: hypothetical protein J6F31_07325 [Oscillospiraceae bacterium]|nr:hypothetical protein [Oscillospiraceae bacterium]
MLVLICRCTAEDDSVRFCVYDTEEKKTELYTNSRLEPLVAAKKVVNAKLENSVIKSTDGSRSIIVLDKKDSKTSSAFYILASYTSPSDNTVYTAVDNLGSLYEFSENLLGEFASLRKIVNIRKSRSGHEVIKVPVYSSVLRKSLAHTNIH